MKSKDTAVIAAGESVLSAVALMLKHERMVLPAEIEHLYELIEGE